MHPQKVHSSVRKIFYFIFSHFPPHATAINPIKIYFHVRFSQCSVKFFLQFCKFSVFLILHIRWVVGCCVHYASSTHAENENEMRLNSLNFLYFVNFFFSSILMLLLLLVPHSTLPFCVMYNEYFA